MSEHFGEHLTIDGYGGNAELLNNKDLVTKLLTELPEILGMHKLTEPMVIYAPELNKKDPGGWSGFVIIAESHISMHTFPKRGFLSADVYTCQNGLDVQAVEKYFKDNFALQELETNFLIRGTRYPAENIQ
jgi:S-adenosylmethionine decarboxylase